MRIALTIHEGRIAPVFDAAQRLLVVDVGEDPALRSEVDLGGISGLERVDLVQETGAEVLVCGGITRPLLHLLEARGIRVRPWVALETDTAIRVVAKKNRSPMKVIVSAKRGGAEAQIEARFGRAPWYVVFNREVGLFESVPNSSLDMQSGIGIQAARLVLDLEATALITGQCGPNAFGTLTAGGVTVYLRVMGTVREAVEALRAGRLTPVHAPTSPGRPDRPHR